MQWLQRLQQLCLLCFLHVLHRKLQQEINQRARIHPRPFPCIGTISRIRIAQQSVEKLAFRENEAYNDVRNRMLVHRRLYL